MKKDCCKIDVSEVENGYCVEITGEDVKEKCKSVFENCYSEEKIKSFIQSCCSS